MPAATPLENSVLLSTGAAARMDCPVCHLAFEAMGVPGGLCPRCLLDPAPPEEPRKAAPLSRPAVEDLDGEFPGFEVECLLGSGGMGAVYGARHRELDRPVAIKILLIDTEAEPLFEERFRREARIMARLDHPNIVRVHDFGKTSSGLCFLIMERVEGVDMALLIRRKEIALSAALTIVSRICDALQHAHGHGFVHRDIKPSNILVGTEGQVKIADFGLAKLLGAEEESITLVGTALGTPHYIAPEQLRNGEMVDHRADLFSLGVMFYEMLTGELPRGVFSPPSTKATLDGQLDAIVLRAMKEKPEERYQQASEIKQDVTEVQHRVESPPEAAGTSWRRRFLRRKPWAVAGILAVMTAMAVWPINKPEKDPASRAGEDALFSRVPSGKPEVKAPSSSSSSSPEPFHIRVPVAPETVTSTQKAAEEARIRRALALLVRENPGLDPSAIELTLNDRRWFLVIHGGEGPEVKLRTLGPLQGLPLNYLKLDGSGVQDLSPLSNVPLQHLMLINMPVTDLSPLKGLPLEELVLANTPCSDVTPVATPLINLMDLSGSQVTDLSQLKHCTRMTNLRISETGITDLSPVRNFPLVCLYMDSSRVTSLEPLRGMPLAYLVCRGNGELDWSPLFGISSLITVQKDDGTITAQELREKYGKKPEAAESQKGK